MKLESINFWFIVLRISVSHSVYQIMDLGTCCFHPPLEIKVSSKFIFLPTKSLFGFFTKNQIQNFCWSENFGLLGIKSVHDQPNFPSWYTRSWPYIVPPRVEPQCQLPLLLVYWSYQEKNTHAMLYKCEGVCWLKYGTSGLQIIALAGVTNLYFK